MWHSRRDTYETQSVGIWMVPDVSRQIRIWHPTRNELDGIDGDTQEGDDVRVRQVFPHGRHLVEGLRVFRNQTWGECYQNAPS